MITAVLSTVFPLPYAILKMLNFTGDTESWKLESQKLKNEKIDKIFNDVKDWLGEGATKQYNKAGDPYFMSENGLKKVRWDWNRTNPHDFKHLHFEIYQNGKWIDAFKGKKQIGKW